MAAKVNLELTIKDFKELAAFLERREGDIAHDMEDFGDLRSLYVAVFDDEPKKD